MPRRVATGDVLTNRALNRALLDRQRLLRRHDFETEATIEHLLGLQAQVPKDPYTGLWTRLEGFRPDTLSQLLIDRRVVRTTLMRSTIHLVTAADAVRLRPLLQPVIFRMNRDSVFGRQLAGLDLDAVAEEGRRLVDEKPRTGQELGRLLAGRWPDHHPFALSTAARTLVPMVQITPRGVWGASLQTTWAPLDTWLRETSTPGPEAGLTIDDLVLRYLTAWGPALVKDMQGWSGLTRLAEVFDRLRPRLRTYRNEQAGELFDLPDAPRPDPDTPAPVRFLPEYDNVGLGLADRSRLVMAERPLPVMVRDGSGWGSVLVDGCFQGMWRIFVEEGSPTLVIAPTEKYAPPDRAALIDEGRRLLGFHAPQADADRYEVNVAPLN